MKTIRLALLVIIVIIFSACKQAEMKESSLSLLKTTNPPPVSVGKSTNKEDKLIHGIEKVIEDFDEIYDVAVLKGEEETLVVYKVKHMKRFYMKKIEKKVNKLLENKYPDEDFIVSSDYKIFLEAVKLQEKLEDPTYPRDKAKKKLKEIIELKKELT